MTNYKNDLPLFAEQITINEEVEQIQEALSRFSQLKPSGSFIQIETDYIFTTKSKWNKSLSERYSFEYEGDWFQIDIPHPLLEKLGLEKGKEIPHPFHLDSKVLERKPTCGGITINDQKEIFLQKPFTIQNLEQNLNNLFQQIEKLEREKNLDKKTIEDLEKAKNDWKNEWLTEWRKNRTLTTEKNSLTTQRDDLQTQLNQVQDECDTLPILPTLIDYLLLQTERDNAQIHLGINNLNNLPELPVGETLTSLLARPTLTQLNDLRREKDQELTTKNTKITGLTNDVNRLNNELTIAKRELEKEQKWWGKWFNYNINSYKEYDKVVISEIKKNLSQLGADTRYLSYKLSMQGSDIYENQASSVDILESRKFIQAVYMYFRDR